MADAATPPRGPGRSGARASRGSGRRLVTGIVVLAFVTAVLIAVLHDVGDEAPAAGNVPPAQLLAPAATLPELPEATERLTLPSQDAEIEPLAESIDDSPPLRGVATTMSFWDRPLEGANERAPITLIVVDEHDRPVPDARVQVWGEEDEPVMSRPSGERAGRVIRRAPPIGPIPYVTDAQGRCVVQPPLHTPEVLVEKEGVGCSGWLNLASGMRKSRQPRELLVPLQQ